MPRKNVSYHPNDIPRPNRSLKSLWRREDAKYRKAIAQRRRDKLARRQAHEDMLAKKAS